MMLYENIDPRTFDKVHVVRINNQPSIIYRYDVNNSDIQLGVSKGSDTLNPYTISITGHNITKVCEVKIGQYRSRTTGMLYEVKFLGDAPLRHNILALRPLMLKLRLLMTESELLSLIREFNLNSIINE